RSRGQRTRPEGRSLPPIVLVPRNVIGCGRWATAHRVRLPWTEERCQVWPMSRLPVHWQAHLPKQVRKQGVRRLCGTYWVSPWFDDTKTRGAEDRCRRQTPKKTLRLRKSEPRDRGNDLFAPPRPPPLSSMGVGSIATQIATQRQGTALDAEGMEARRSLD